MKSLYMIPLLLFAWLGPWASLAGVASAETTLTAEWLANGKSILENRPFKIALNILIEDKAANAAIICHGTLLGTVGFAGIDSTTEVLNVAKEKVAGIGGLGLLGTGGKKPDCEASTSCAEGTAAAPIQAWPNGLPWGTFLFTMQNGEDLDLAEKTTWDIDCLVLGGINFEDACEFSDSDNPVINSSECHREV